MDKRINYIIEKEKKVIGRFIDAISNTFLKVEVDYPIGEMKSSRFDACILTDESQPYASIEIKDNLKNDIQFKNGMDFLCKSYLFTKTQFCVLTDGNEFYIWKTNENPKPNFEKIKFNELIDVLQEPFQLQNPIKAYNVIKDIFHKEKLFDLEKRFSKEDVNFTGSSFSFSNSFEAKLTSKLVKKNKYKQICRYVPFETIFQMLKNQTIRMNGIAGMNDTTEVNYIEKYIYNTDTSYGKRTDADLLAINSTFITSCSNSELKDDLTQWRLYADDGKGVCLVFNVKNSTSANEFILSEIQYVDEDFMPEEIQLLRKISLAIESKTKMKLIYNNMHQWCHFYKPKDYEIEKEVRLQFIKKIDEETDWVNANSINIINTFTTINLLKNDEFPLILKEIILGPKFPEKDINMGQIRTLLNTKGFVDVEVKLSRIHNYR